MGSLPRSLAERDRMTPRELAEFLGCSERLVRRMARDLGACSIAGRSMILTGLDVVAILKASRPNVSYEDVKDWLTGDAAELLKEQEAQEAYSQDTPTGVVYFVRRGAEVKIGFTTDLPKRVGQFRTATTDDFHVLLTIPAAPSLETYFHEKFAAHRIKREWFIYHGEIEAFIARRRFGR